MKGLIREAKEINSLINAFAKKNPNINPKDLEQLFTADPTTVQNSRGVFAGKYCVWIGNQYVNGKLKVGDIPELKKALKTYNINKSQITTPINNIGSLSDLITIISDYTDDFKATRQLSKGEQALEKVYEDAEWVVYIPHTYEASRKIGGDTNWCTASSDDRYFNMYTKDGPLYVNIRKSDGSKYQFHFDSRQFMNAVDEPVDLKKFPFSKGLLNFYKTICSYFDAIINYGGDLDEFKYNIARIYSNGQYNYVNIKGELLSPKQWFDEATDFYLQYDDGGPCAQVNIYNKGTNFLLPNGKLVSPNIWFDAIYEFKCGWARCYAENEGGCNYVNRDGQFLLPQWVKDGFDFFKGYARIVFGKNILNLIDTKGNLVLKHNVQEISMPMGGDYLYVIESDILPALYATVDVRNGDLFDYHHKYIGNINTGENLKNVTIKENTEYNILKDALPSDISTMAENGGTALGNNPAFPDIFDKPFIYTISKQRFEETKNALKEIGEINDVEESDIPSALARLIQKCKEIEKPYRTQLERICFNYVVDLFGVPKESVDILMELKDAIDLNRDSIILDPIDGNGDDGIEFNDVNDALSIKDEVYKRRLLDALCMGGAMSMSSNIESYENQINQINPSLCDLYNKILSLNNYLMFTKENLDMTDENKMQLGTVEVSLGMRDEKPKIESQGVIFPVLLSESIRGFLELFISHGLPKNRERAMAVIGKADYLKAEPWDMRLGPSLWTLFSNSFNDINSTDLPYLLKGISSLSIDNFNYLMKEVFAKTKKGRLIMSKLSQRAKNDAEYDKFVDKMDKMKQNKAIITDEYIHEDEL